MVWLTGLSGAGKSTLAYGAQKQLLSMSLDCAVIDGDVLRHGLCRDLGYSEADRCENIRRAGEIALSRAEAGALVIVALISPIERARRAVQARCKETGTPFALVYVNASLSSCEQRDPKGLYRRARDGLIPEFTGVSSVYEPPTEPSLVIRTDLEPVQASIERVVALGMSIVKRDPSFWALL